MRRGPLPDGSEVPVKIPVEEQLRKGLESLFITDGGTRRWFTVNCVEATDGPRSVTRMLLHAIP